MERIDDVKNIYDHLQDETSRFIFGKRLMFSYTQDWRYIYEIVATLPEARWLNALLEDGEENFLFCAGIYGRSVYHLAPHAWKGILDNDEAKQGIDWDGVKISSPDILRRHPGARVVLATWQLGDTTYCDEILQQLAMLGVTENRVIRVDKIMDYIAQTRTYFDLIALPRASEETFVDVGCYDGGTSVSFARWAGTFQHIYAFEPDRANRLRAEVALSRLGHEKYTLIPYGAWSEKAELQFDDSGSVNSCVSKSGSIRIPVTTIDEELVGERVTYIKMDIEGSELEALRGAERTICVQRPKLAISVYHKPEDIWEIPSYLLSLHSDYCFYLRHYTFSRADTVLYAI